MTTSLTNLKLPSGRVVSATDWAESSVVYTPMQVGATPTALWLYGLDPIEHAVQEELYREELLRKARERTARLKAKIRRRRRRPGR